MPTKARRKFRLCFCRLFYLSKSRFWQKIFRTEAKSFRRGVFMFDVAVIGAGVVGGFCARELMKYRLSVVILEGADDVAAGASRANSGIVHAGFDAKEGSLKAKFNVLGNRMMPKVCEELGVGYKNNGSIVVAFGKEQEKTLSELKERGEINGVEGLKIVDGGHARKLEPNLSEEVTAALIAPTGGIVCPFTLNIAAVGNAMDNGAKLRCGFKVIAVQKEKEGYKLISENGEEVFAKYVINCAGAGSEKVANLFADTSFRIMDRKGEYILLDSSVKNYAHHTVFAVPTAAGKGVLVSPTTDGNILVGPTSVEEENYDTSVRVEGFAEIKDKASKMMKSIPFFETITSFAGVRAYCDRHDFVIEESKTAENLFNVGGIESPGLTASPAIGKYVAEKVAEKLRAEKNEKFDPVRRVNHFKELSEAEKNKVIAKHPEYGKIVCRCENVTLGEILESLRANPPAKTIDGIKLRTRAGMGRCQSGFCQPHVFNILMKEYGYRADEVTKKGGKSYIIVGGEL